jgi:hypothetical protein
MHRIPRIGAQSALAVRVFRVVNSIHWPSPNEERKIDQGIDLGHSIEEEGSIDLHDSLTSSPRRHDTSRRPIEGF